MKTKTDVVALIGTTVRTGIKAPYLPALLLGSLAICIASPLTLGVLAGPLLLGYSAVCLRMVRGEAVSTDVLWSGFSRFGTALFGALMVAALTLVGSLVVVGGLVVLFFLTFMFLFLADRPELKAVEAGKASFELVKKHPVDVALYWLVSLIVGGLLGGTVVLSIVAVAFSSLLGAALYARLTGPDSDEV